MLLQACSKGSDHRLDTGHGMKPTRPPCGALKDMPDKEQRAYDWAVSDFNLEQLHASYPNGTPKAIIRAERDKVIRDVPAKLAQLETARAAYVAGQADLSRITASDVHFTMEKDFSACSRLSSPPSTTAARTT
jgi:predicted GNAT family acetyltransferase